MTKIKNYLINNKFIFETEKCLIFLNNETDQFIELSKPASRLLNEIIILNQESQIATRDDLLTNVWEKHGLVGSNNNLNTYVSEIRKKFELIGIDPKSIVTVPKRGFRFDCKTVEIITQENSVSSLPEEEFIHYGDKPKSTNIVHHDENSIDPNKTHDNQSIINKNAEIHEFLTVAQENKNETALTQPVKKQENIRNNYVLFILIAIITVSLTLTFHFIKDSDASMQMNGYIAVNQRAQCIIQIPIHLAENSSKDHLDFINRKLDKYNVDCNQPKRIILLSEPNNMQPADKNLSISICKEKNTQYDCVSINDQRI
ncbi:winged helix-turn-helix domain-containing protein [Providencia manganoxydans]|uniref:winged helix-turn-helix domain-containing protein n=1 Tax=Providencia manganoxydans TaxID=2923283 RepID=UPI0034E4F37E